MLATVGLDRWGCGMGVTTWLDAAAPVCAAAQQHADETEAGHRLAAPVVEAFEASGLAAAWLPRAIGGTGASPRDVVETVEAIAMSDASTGWCAAIGIGSNFLAGLVPEHVARGLFHDPAKGGAGPFEPASLAAPSGDGVHIAGRWRYASNCQQAGVIAAGVIIPGPDGRPQVGPNGVELGLAFLSADDISIDECWNMDGLRGTGSHDVLADVQIDRDRISSLWARAWPDDTLYRMRPFDVLGPALSVVTLAIGRAALDVLREKTLTDAAGAPRPGPRPRLADDPVAQLQVGAAEVRLRSVRTLLFDLVDESFERAGRGDTPSRETSAMIGLACGETFRAARDVVAAVTALMGSAATREGSPLGRLRRDLNAAGSHVMFSHGLQVGLGRELAGLPTAAFPFLPGTE
jgi:alkylation response protein AidB-like acyl-CoA dehydrogenase